MLSIDENDMKVNISIVCRVRHVVDRSVCPAAFASSRARRVSGFSRRRISSVISPARSRSGSSTGLRRSRAVPGGQVQWDGKGLNAKDFLFVTFLFFIL